MRLIWWKREWKYARGCDVFFRALRLSPSVKQLVLTTPQFLFKCLAIVFSQPSSSLCQLQLRLDALIEMVCVSLSVPIREFLRQIAYKHQNLLY
jgi:hypothetical protein